MIKVSAETHIRCTPEQVRDFVLDVERYRLADHKIGKVRAREELDGDAVVTFRTNMRGMIASTRQRLHVVGTERIEVSALPSWQDKLVQFHGLFEFRPDEDGTHVRHAYEFSFSPAVKWMMEPYLRSWLARNIDDEVKQMKVLLENETSATKAGPEAQHG